MTRKSSRAKKKYSSKIINNNDLRDTSVLARTLRASWAVNR